MHAQTNTALMFNPDSKGIRMYFGTQYLMLFRKNTPSWTGDRKQKLGKTWFDEKQLTLEINKGNTNLDL